MPPSLLPTNQILPNLKNRKSEIRNPKSEIKPLSSPLQIEAHIANVVASYRLLLNEPMPQWDSQVKSLYLHLHEHLFEPICTIGEARHAHHLADNNISYKFLKTTKMRPKEYVAFHRVQVAKQLLQETTAPIVVIADAVGFTQSALLKAFHRIENLTPTEYREIHLSKP